MSAFKFEILHRSTKSRARVGRIHTPHGIIETPNFVPVGTHAALKAIEPAMADSLGIQLMFCNTYHLLLHPGPEVVEKAGGLHTFMQRKGPIITDSGGFQVFSLAYGTVHAELKSKGQKTHAGSVVKITEEGALFRSYRDGARILLTPESSVAVQKSLGADIIIPLDELPPYHIDKRVLRASLERTHRWETRSLMAHKAQPNNQAMYAVIHGGIDPEMRRQSADYLAKLPFDGFAIGGSLGKNHDEMVTMLTDLMPHIPYEMPNHLLGIGDLRSLERCVPLGIDTFDSSHPTRCARHGLIFTRKGDLKILQGQYKAQLGPLDETCGCPVCLNYSVAYIHHLFKTHEMTGYTLASIHNVYFMMELMRRYREMIAQDLI